MSFHDLQLEPEILKAIDESGYTNATPIQQEAIPAILEGKDIRASAQTGTGKTAAFLLPALSKLTKPSKLPGKGARVLILAPTRELAMQITVQAEKYSNYLRRIKTVCVGGGVPYHPQLKQLSRPYEILIATPGRLIDLMERGKIDFSRLELMVLDEADRMLDMGFIDPVEQIVEATPESRQTLLFSATMQGSVLKLSKRLLQKPVDIAVNTEHERHENIEQRLLFVDNIAHKNDLLDHLLIEKDVENTIIFTSTKRQADSLVDELLDKGHKAAALHGDMNQRQRTRTITQLRNGRVRVLVATDVAARGIDVQSISHVINFDLPRHFEDYVHRIGRTGRAGAKGVALSFAGVREGHLVKKIENFTGQPINVVEIEGLEPRAKKPAPRRGGPRRNSSFPPRSGGFRSGPGKANSRNGKKKPGRANSSSSDQPRYGKPTKSYGQKRSGAPAGRRPKKRVGAGS